MSDETSPSSEEAEPQPDGARQRAWLPTLLIVLATVIAVVSALTTWVRYELLDTDEWVEVSSDLLAEPEVQEALTTYLSNQLFERVDLQSELGELLPEPFDRLAGPIAGALRDPVTNSIARVISSERFATLWENANRAAHERLVAILRDETRPSVSTADGTVTLELGTALRNVGEAVGIPDAALDRIPADAGTIVIFESEELAAVQEAVEVLDFLSWFLFVLVIVLYVVAVVLARGWRIRALRNVGIGLFVGGLVVLVLRALAVRATVNHVIEDPNRHALGEVVASVATQLLSESAWTGIVYGALIAGFAALMGEHRWAVAARRGLGRATESTGAAVAVAVVAVLVLLWWSPGRSFDRPLNAFVFVALAVAAVVSLITLSRREYRTPVVVE